MSALFVPPPLSLIMVAPNGARRTKADHSALPMTIAETVVAAKACLEAGAGALHAHVRDLTGAHVLDAGLYRELLSEMRVAVPQMQVQITTEAVGKYTPEEQRELVYKVKPDAVSVAIREMVPEGGEDQAKPFTTGRSTMNVRSSISSTARMIWTGFSTWRQPVPWQGKAISCCSFWGAMRQARKAHRKIWCRFWKSSRNAARGSRWTGRSALSDTARRSVWWRRSGGAARPGSVLKTACGTGPENAR